MDTVRYFPTLPPEIWELIICDYDLYFHLETIDKIPSKYYIMKTIYEEYIKYILNDIIVDQVINKPYIFNNKNIIEIIYHLTDYMTIDYRNITIYYTNSYYDSISIIFRLKNKSVEIHYNNSCLVYMVNRLMHRIGAPAHTRWYLTGLKQEIYFNNEKRHRTDGPAHIEWYNNGNKATEIYYLNDKCGPLRPDEPAVIQWYRSGVKSNEWYYVDNKVHRIDEPAHIKWFENGCKLSEVYYINNKMHRIDGPAQICWFDDGSKKCHDYYINDKMHRIDEPASIEWYRDGSIYKEEYRIDDKVHRIDEPAFIGWHRDGTIWKKEYRMDGYLHRIDGPASIEYYYKSKSNQKKKEMYCIKGKLHRIDGPAYIMCEENGSILEETYFIDNKLDLTRENIIKRGNYNHDTFDKYHWDVKGNVI